MEELGCTEKYKTNPGDGYGNLNPPAIKKSKTKGTRRRGDVVYARME